MNPEEPKPNFERPSLTDPRGRSRYDRAGDRYRCGKAPGSPRCEFGPNAFGVCRDGACKPRLRMVWAVKKIRSGLVFFGICLLAGFLASPFYREFFAPGPLSHAHAQILNRDGAIEGLSENRCAACHAVGILPAISWISGFHQQTKSQQSLCLECHQSQMPDLTRRSPHDLPEYAFQDPHRFEPNTHWVSTNSPNPVKAVAPSKKWVTPQVAWRNADFACGDCHREHQGSQHDLQHMTQERCQSCHQTRFPSFAEGHPEFAAYPYHRPQQLSFDHQRHRDLHYAKDQSTFDCRACHISQSESGQVGQVFRSVSYEQACAKCHQAPLRAALSDGLVVFQLPNIDPKLLPNSEIASRWPTEASHVMDGTIPPVMQMLLEADPELSELFHRLQHQRINFAKLDPSNLATRADINSLLEGSHRLLRDLAENGQAAVRQRLTHLTDPTSSKLVSADAKRNSAMTMHTTGLSQTQDQAALFEGLPPDLFRQAWSRWFAPSAPPPADSRLLSPPSQAKVESPTPSSNLLDADNLLTSDPLLPSSVSPPKNASELKPLRSGQQLEAGGWMFDERRLAIVYIPQGHADPFVSAWTGLAQTIQDARRTVPNGSQLPTEEDALHAILSNHSAGRCTECHRLNTHVQEVSSHGARGNRPGLTTSLWRTERRPATLRQATRFDHGPHLMLPTLQDCIACHRLPSAGTSLPGTSLPGTSLPGTSLPETSTPQSPPAPTADPHSRTSEFLSISKADCATCHTSKAAGDRCTLCHNYHVGEASWVWDRRPLPNDLRLDQLHKAKIARPDLLGGPR